MQAPFSIHPLAQAIVQFKIELQTAAVHGPSPMARIGAWLKENRELLASKPSLYRDLEELNNNVASWAGLAPERGQVLARIQLLMSDQQKQWSREEWKLNHIESDLTPDFFPPFKRSAGRVVDAAEQLASFVNALISYEQERISSPSLEMHPGPRAQWVVDRVLYENLALNNLLSAEDHLFGDWTRTPSVSANKWRIRLETEQFPPLKAIERRWPFSPELAHLKVAELTLYGKVAISVGLMSSLRTLSLIHLTQFPPQILNLTQLEQLKIVNGIIEIPEGISALANLTDLDLRNNKLQALPESIIRFTKLETLLLDDNYFTSIPQHIVNLTTLKSLSVRTTWLPDSRENSAVEYVDEEIGACTQLTHLYCDVSVVPFLPDTLTQCVALEHVGPMVNGWSKNQGSLSDYLKAARAQRTFKKLQ